MLRTAYKQGVLMAAAWLYVASWPIAAESVSVRVLDASGTPVPNAVVYLEGSETKPDGHAARAVVDQIDETFVPQLTVIQTGTIVEFPNSDAVSHHVYSFARPNSFELPLYKGQLTPEVRFDHAGVVTLGCNIHDTMLGYIVVVDGPNFGITDSDGVVVLSGMANGHTPVLIWSQRLDPARPLRFEMDFDGTESGNRVITLERRLKSKPRAGGGSLAWDDY